MRAKFSGRLTEHAFEHAVELRERLESYVVSDFADATVWIQKLRARVLETHARDVIGEFQAGRFVKNFAEMKDARASRFSHSRQRKWLRLVLVDVFARFEDERRLGILSFYYQLIAQGR